MSTLWTFLRSIGEMERCIRVARMEGFFGVMEGEWKVTKGNLRSHFRVQNKMFEMR